MAKRTGAAHVVTIKKTVNGREYRTDLLRRSYRDGKHVRNETLGNLTHLGLKKWSKFGGRYGARSWSISTTPSG